jgi:glycosyltransferase involved in cell wall biosynthesis
MHIAIVCRWYPPHSGFGGVAMHNYYLARELVKEGHRVTAIAARWSADVPAEEESEGVAVRRILFQHQPWMHRLPIVGRHARGFVQWQYSRRVAKALRALEESARPDIVEFADIEAEGYAYLRRAHRCPVVVRCHTPGFVLYRHYLPEERPWNTERIEAREKFCIGQADALTAPSRDMARTISTECTLREERICVIPNALDVTPFITSERKPDARDEVLILNVGRLDRGKGIAVLAEAIPHVRRQAPTVRFVFVGENRPDGYGGTWRSRLEERLRTAGVHDRVQFTGGVSPPELIAWYSRADIAVVPSLIYESFSYTCAQAAAAGLPVVASRIGGIPDTIEHNVAGILTEPGDIGQLASALVRLARDRELRESMGAAGREKAAGEFNARIVAERMANFYSRVSGAGGAASETAATSIAVG